MTRPRLLLILPDLGGIGKTTVSEHLVALREVAGQPVLAIDGDPTSRGLIARRAEKKTIPVAWKAEVASQAASIRNAVQGSGGFGVLDFGGGSTHVMSVEPTIEELCQTSHEVETIVVAVLEASKIGLASSVSRLMQTFPNVRFVLCRNQKAGNNWSSFAGLEAPLFTMPQIPVAITEFLTHHNVTTDPHTKEKQRPALSDLVQQPEDDFHMLGLILAGIMRNLSRQRDVQELLQMTDLPIKFLDLNRSLRLRPGPMTNEYLVGHQRAAESVAEIFRATVPPKAEEDAFKAKMGEKVLTYARHQAKLDALRMSWGR